MPAHNHGINRAPRSRALGARTEPVRAIHELPLQANRRTAHQNRCSLNEISDARGDWPVAMFDLCGVERLLRVARGGSSRGKGVCRRDAGGLSGAEGDRWLLRGVLCLIGLDLFYRLTSMSRRSPSIPNRLGRMSNRSSGMTDRSTIMSSGSAPMTNRLGRMSNRLAERTNRPPSMSNISPRRTSRMAGKSRASQNVLNEFNTPAKMARENEK